MMNPSWQLENILKETSDLLAFQPITFGHCYREANKHMYLLVNVRIDQEPLPYINNMHIEE